MRSSTWWLISASASFGSIAAIALPVKRPTCSETFSAFSRCDSHAPVRSGRFAAATFSVISSAFRKFSPTNSLSAPPIWSFFFGTSAVCGIGMPIGYRNSAVTANQSASPPTMPASDAARTYGTQPGAAPRVIHHSHAI